MIKIILSCLLTLSISVAFSQNSADLAKPSLKLDVSIDGKQYSVNEGDTLHYENKTIIIKTSNELTFNHGVLKFDYPKHFAFEFEEDVSYKNWTLDGNNFVIMYFEIDSKIELESFIKEMVNKFGKKNCTTVNKQIKLGNRELLGKRINVNVLGTKLTFDMYQLETNDNKTHFISFQDTKNDDGSDSKEGLETMTIINKTIQ